VEDGRFVEDGRLNIVFIFHSIDTITGSYKIIPPKYCIYQRVLLSKWKFLTSMSNLMPCM